MFYVHLLYNVYIIIEYLLCKEHILYLSVYKYLNLCLCVCLPTVQVTEEAKASPVTVHFLLSLKLFSRAVIAPVVYPYLVQTSAVRDLTLL